jgi:hypothetical protein
MARKFVTHINLNQNELQNAVVQRLASHPSDVEGQIHYLNSDDCLYLKKATTRHKILDDSAINTSTSLSGASDANVPSTTAIKTYVDNLVQGINWGQAVRVASVANVNLSNELENGDTLDGVTLATGDRVLLKNQTDAEDNGVYVVAASGAASRAAETGAQLANHAFFVEEGATNADTVWIITNDAITLGTTELVINQLSGGSVPDATDSVKGKVELATVEEAEGKTDTGKAVTPAGLASFPKKYTFEISSASSGTVGAATHELGATKAIICQFFEDGTPNTQVEVDVSVADNGDVSWQSTVAITGYGVLVG